MKTEIISGKNNGSISNLAKCLPPIGTIVALVGGYFSATGNGGTFTSIFGTSVSDANTYLGLVSGGEQCWVVCDGTILNDPDSPIFNGPGRYLPDLTDGRFLMGSTSSGSALGNNSLNFVHNHPLSVSGTIGSHTHSLAGCYAHCGFRDSTNQWFFETAGGANEVSGYGTLGAFFPSSNGAYATPISVNNVGLGGTPVSANLGSLTSTGTSGPALGATDIRPQYFTCFYAMRIK